MSDNLPTITDTTAVEEIGRSLLFEGEPSLVFEKAAQKRAEGKLHEMNYTDLKKLALAPGVGTQVSIAGTVDDIYTPLAVSYARQLIQEYKCQTPSEITMAEVTAISYVHFIVASRWLTAHVNDRFFDKKADSAHRRFISSMGALRQMRRPRMSVKVIAETAFVAENQINQQNKGV